MDAVQVDGDVNVHDVAVGQRPTIGDPMADHLVDRGTDRLGVAAVVQRAGVATAGHRGCVHDLVQMIGSHAGYHVGPHLEQNPSRCLAGPTHPLHLLGCAH